MTKPRFNVRDYLPEYYFRDPLPPYSTPEGEQVAAFCAGIIAMLDEEPPPDTSGAQGDWNTWRRALYRQRLHQASACINAAVKRGTLDPERVKALAALIFH